jgi:hypothetical protein
MAAATNADGAERVSGPEHDEDWLLPVDNHGAYGQSYWCQRLPGKPLTPLLWAALAGERVNGSIAVKCGPDEDQQTDLVQFFFIWALADRDEAAYDELKQAGYTPSGHATTLLSRLPGGWHINPVFDVVRPFETSAERQTFEDDQRNTSSRAAARQPTELAEAAKPGDGYRLHLSAEDGVGSSWPMGEMLLTALWYDPKAERRMTREVVEAHGFRVQPAAPREGDAGKEEGKQGDSDGEGEGEGEDEAKEQGKSNMHKRRRDLVNEHREPELMVTPIDEDDLRPNILVDWLTPVVYIKDSPVATELLAHMLLRSSLDARPPQLMIGYEARHHTATAEQVDKLTVRVAQLGAAFANSGRTANETYRRLTAHFFRDVLHAQPDLLPLEVWQACANLIVCCRTRLSEFESWDKKRIWPRIAQLMEETDDSSENGVERPAKRLTGHL